MTTLSATDVARNFSGILNRVSGGEEIEIVRNGVPIAHLSPPTAVAALSADRWREVMDSAPSVDEDFANELARARERVGPPTGAWPS